MGWRSRISRLTARRIFVLSVAMILILLLRWLFRMPLRLACRILESWFGERSFIELSDETVRADIGWAVSVASRYAPGSRCLDRALAAKVLVAAFRRNCSLRVGVMPAPSGSLLGHAWIESAAGIVIGGEPVELEKYKVLPQTMTLEQQIVFFLAMQKKWGANINNRATSQALDIL